MTICLYSALRTIARKGASFQGNHADADGQQYLPLYEAKMFWYFDHRFGTYAGQTSEQANQGKLPELSPAHHLDPDGTAIPRYWVSANDVCSHVENPLDFTIVIRAITGATAS